MISVKRQWSGCTWENYVDLQYAAVVNTTEDAYLVKEYYSLLSVIKILYHTTKDYTMVKSDIPWISKLTLGCQPKHALIVNAMHSAQYAHIHLLHPLLISGFLHNHLLYCIISMIFLYHCQFLP